MAVDTNGIPIGCATDGANRNDVTLLEPTLDAIVANGLLADIELLTLDRGYDFPIIRTRLAGYGLDELEIQRRGTKPPPGTSHRLTLGLRWIIEALNSWWSNYGQLRRSTDRKTVHRLAALSLATTILMTCRLIDAVGLRSCGLLHNRSSPKRRRHADFHRPACLRAVQPP